ncbi:rhomboid-related protein 4-like [Ornithodoros turicata]|uniref:rhomboid-related protein 4-like n=1 Tax=Ornithodoros turicata TaxID=34597 RepID=UPI00313A1895
MPRRRDTAGVLLLLIHILFKVGLVNIPPVTLRTVILLSCIYMHVVDLPWATPLEVCVGVEPVVFKDEWWRIFCGPLEHADSLHLYCNMVSFIWKGTILETELGSRTFMYVLCAFTVLTGLMFVLLEYICGVFIDKGHFDRCAVGFSSVVFSLKVLNNHYFPGKTPRILNIDLALPSGYVVWVELVVNQIISPNSSFIGHLSGILIGLLFVYFIEPMFDASANMWMRRLSRSRSSTSED